MTPRELDHIARHGRYSHVAHAELYDRFATCGYQYFSRLPLAVLMSRALIRSAPSSVKAAGKERGLEAPILAGPARVEGAPRADLQTSFVLPTRICAGGCSRLRSHGGTSTCVQYRSGLPSRPTRSTDTKRRAPAKMPVGCPGSARSASPSAIWRASLSQEKQQLAWHTSPNATCEPASAGCRAATSLPPRLSAPSCSRSCAATRCASPSEAA